MVGAGLWGKDPRKQEGRSRENEEEKENALEVALSAREASLPRMSKEHRE